jgi:hypothetical protein
MKGICQCANVPDMMNPVPRPLNAASWITWVDSKKDGDLLAMAIMAVLPHLKHFQCPTLCPVAPLNCHAELNNINEHPTWDPTNAKGGSTVPEGIDSMLHPLCLGLICLNRSNFLGDIQLL